MRSTNFDNLKQQNGLDSSCKAALRQSYIKDMLLLPNRPQGLESKTVILICYCVLTPYGANGHSGSTTILGPGKEVG
jgi:hypothetical protein